MPRGFDGVDDDLRVSIGNCNIPFGPGTLAAILKRQADGAWHAIIAAHTSGGTARWNMEFSNDGGDVDELAWGDPSAFSSPRTFPSLKLTAADNWALAAVTVPAGASTVRGHLYKYDTDVWLHEDTEDGLWTQGAAPGSDADIRFGEWQGTDRFEGVKEMSGVWDRVLPDDEIELLAHTLQAWYASAAVGLWKLDQENVSQKVSDLTGGGADETADNGTTVSDEAVPLFNWHGGILIPSRVVIVPGVMDIQRSYPRGFERGVERGVA